MWAKKHVGKGDSGRHVGPDLLPCQQYVVQVYSSAKPRGHLHEGLLVSERDGCRLNRGKFVVITLNFER